MDTVSAPSTPAQKPSGAPAVIKTGMDAHGMKFVPREVISDYKDRLYHGKPELNYKGIPYRQPKRIERANAGDRLAVCGRQPVQDWELRHLVDQYYLEFGEKPNTCIYPGTGARRYRGLNFEHAGQLLIELIPDSGDFTAYVCRKGEI